MGPSPREDMVHVFSRPEFDRSPSWWSRATHAIGRIFDRIPFGTTGKFLGWILFALVVGYLGYLTFRAVVRAIARRRSRVKQDHVVDDVMEDMAARDPEEWRAEGLRHESIEDWKEAIRCRYAEIVVTLFRLGRAVDEPGRTTGELRADFARSTPSCAASFAEITEIFEVVWFADRAATRENHHVLVGLIGRIHQSLAAPANAGSGGGGVVVVGREGAHR